MKMAGKFFKDLALIEIDPFRRLGKSLFKIERDDA
jgi:hypothetical protein